MSVAKIRAMLAADPEVGVGNVLHKLIEYGEPLDGPGLTFDTDIDGIPAFTGLTLGTLYDRAAARAAWFHANGIRPRDPVAVYVTNSADMFLCYLGLTWLGAIPCLMNPNIPGEIAAEYINKLRAIGVITDAARRERLAGQELNVPFLGDTLELGTGDPGQAPARYHHHDTDPVAVTHSSGTTRLPTAAVQTHGNLFASIRRIRLGNPRAQGTTRVMCALPAPHAAGIVAISNALSNRAELLYLSQQDDGAAVLDAIERWKPSGVFGFAVTWAELARYDLAKRDLDSVALWFNTGDCAHETHIRNLIAVGSRDTVTREGVKRTKGSWFVDGLGSTEMGHAAFHITHNALTDRYGRCIGIPHVFAEIALLDVKTGKEVPVGQVGACGLKSPTLSPGYWNDSVNTYRNRLNGYYLTGDLLYRDEAGYYYHVDRAVDAIDLGGGEYLYTAMSEENILKACPDVRDCTVVSAPTDGGVVTDVLLALHTGADPAIDRTDAVRAALTPAAAATLRQVVVIEDDQLIVGPTGKVRKFLMRQQHLAKLAAAHG